MAREAIPRPIRRQVRELRWQLLRILSPSRRLFMRTLCLRARPASGKRAFKSFL